MVNRPLSPKVRKCLLHSPPKASCNTTFKSPLPSIVEIQVRKKTFFFFFFQERFQDPDPVVRAPPFPPVNSPKRQGEKLSLHPTFLHSLRSFFPPCLYVTLRDFCKGGRFPELGPSYLYYVLPPSNGREHLFPNNELFLLYGRFFLRIPPPQEEPLLISCTPPSFRAPSSLDRAYVSLLFFSSLRCCVSRSAPHGSLFTSTPSFSAPVPTLHIAMRERFFQPLGVKNVFVQIFPPGNWSLPHEPRPFLSLSF